MTLDIYAKLGVRTWINGSGYLTRLGGSRLRPEVLEAMAEASKSFVDIGELQVSASEAIARHTGAEAGIVTSGASAALTLAAAACIAGLDPARMDRLPDTGDIPHEVIMPRTHRNSYDHALRVAGARIVEYGMNDNAMSAGYRGPELWEAEALITENTVAFAFLATASNLGELEALATLAWKYKLPVIVDAAPWLPPVGNLRRFVDAGASLVAFSAGKALRGPQGAGILCGSRNLVGSAMLQQLDMNVPVDSWAVVQRFLQQERPIPLPRHGVGRGMKVSKEDIVGTIIALEAFVEADHEGENLEKELMLVELAQSLARLSGLQAVLRTAAQTGRRPLLEINIDVELAGLSAKEIAQRMTELPRPIQLQGRRILEGILTIDPACIDQQDCEMIVEAFVEILGGVSA